MTYRGSDPVVTRDANATMEPTPYLHDLSYEVIYYRDGRVEFREAGTDDAWLRSSDTVDVRH